MKNETSVIRSVVVMPGMMISNAWANERFVANAPSHVVEAEREKLERYRRELDALGG